MSKRRFDLEAGGDSFAFKPETESKIEFWLSKYPEDRKRSGVIPLLWLAQKDNKGWLSEPAMRAVADRLDMSYIRVYEVATFYTMFRLQPVGGHHVQLCGTTPCMLRGADTLKKVCEKRIGAKGAVSENGKLSWEEVECLGACVNAPMMQINDYYFEDLDEESFTKILDQIEAGEEPEPGTRVYRQTSGPEGGLTTLLDDMLYDGSRAQPLTSIPGAPEDAPTAEPEAVAPPPPAPEKKEEPQKEVSLEDKNRPIALDAPKGGEKDDLKRISGVGPKIEGILNELGVFHFGQIAEWTRDNVEWVDSYLSFKGRIDRENWIEQAKLLADGETTEFAKRVDAGDVPSSEKRD